MLNGNFLKVQQHKKKSKITFGKRDYPKYETSLNIEEAIFSFCLYFLRGPRPISPLGATLVSVLLIDIQQAGGVLGGGVVLIDYSNKMGFTVNNLILKKSYKKYI